MSKIFERQTEKPLLFDNIYNSTGLNFFFFFVCQTMNYVLGKVENIVVKGENAGF